MCEGSVCVCVLRGGDREKVCLTNEFCCRLCMDSVYSGFEQIDEAPKECDAPSHLWGQCNAFI